MKPVVLAVGICLLIAGVGLCIFGVLGFYNSPTSNPTGYIAPSVSIAVGLILTIIGAITIGKLKHS